ncbi:DUF6434 domain-containing protein [Arthrobacter sulfonylureivorans]|uniref:SAP domain-containing protein n=1 Tax=Arthrobacter sulfonylureivorans TaxID=2486855 RepID=A0ABY3WHM0_9MICC|nr:DUF6434 domain-containing protein [Arthrobacter sulfonylureivorans]UNK47807.1 SAP domain-containing protein [Arthrobacter sulfonylureivorans]
MDKSISARPPLTPELSGAEFLRWYWLKEELADFARVLGKRASGSKELLTQRIAAALDGQVFEEPKAPKRATGNQLTGPLSLSTPIPAGQRCSQILRKSFTEQVGPTFHFDAEMRAFFARTDGTQTMEQALDHWHESRDQAKREIDPQFEYNRFTRAWHESNPHGTKRSYGLLGRSTVTARLINVGASESWTIRL